MTMKKFLLRAAAFAAAALLFLYSFPAYAAGSDALQGQVNDAQQAYESAAQTLENMQQQADSTRQQLGDLQNRTAELRGQLGCIVAQLQQSRNDLAQAQNQAAAAARALEEKQAAFDAHYAACKQQLAAMEILNEGGSIGLLLQANDLYELLTFWEVLNSITEHNKKTLDALEAEAAALDVQRQQVEDTAAQAEQAAAALQERQNELTQAQAQLEESLMQASEALSAQQAAAEAQAAVTQEKREAYEQATAALDAYLKGQSRKYQSSALHCSLDFVCPLPYVSRISTYFGEPDAVYSKPHTGADLPAANGTPVHAVADGIVSAASARPSYGNCVQLDHGTAADGSSYATLYAHLSSYCVSAGQNVRQGDVIGYVGNTGDVRGANGGYHLHLELRINGTRTDPLQCIPH